jgi:hypothetical protein
VEVAHKPGRKSVTNLQIVISCALLKSSKRMNIKKEKKRWRQNSAIPRNVQVFSSF